ncbi:MAG: hypothetical protein V4482_06410 [Pseudomonadota bacterium]
MSTFKKISQALGVSAVLLSSAQQGHAGVKEFIENQLSRPEAPMTTVDFAGMGQTPPGWTGYPAKSVDGEPINYDIALPSTNNDGFSPRNLAKNMQVNPLDPLRQAMPADLPHASLSLYTDESMSILRPAVIEWLNIRYRNELGGRLMENEQAIALVREKGITYENIWFWNPKVVPQLNGNPIELIFDNLGRPINPYPVGKDLNLSGRGFYFFFGENPAVDPLITLELNGKIYALFIQRNERATKKSDGAPAQLSFPGGMHDIDKTQVDPLGSIIKELGEETGLLLDSDRIIRSNLAKLVSSDVVSGEARTTRNAWTTSHFYHLHFNNIHELKNYIKTVSSLFDGHEVSKVLFLDIRYVLSNYVMPDAEGSMFASHGKMFTKALVDFFTHHPDKRRYLTGSDRVYKSYRDSRLSMNELQEAVNRQPIQRELKDAIQRYHHLRHSSPSASSSASAAATDAPFNELTSRR